MIVVVVVADRVVAVMYHALLAAHAVLLELDDAAPPGVRQVEAPLLVGLDAE